jgi:8-oxo-dGTP pyrophosphatase MutT (NUDIX family)
VTPAEAVELRDAATVLILRDGVDGLEVFMLRRNLNSDFVGGAYVFPGGAVDPEDRHTDLEPVCEGRTDADASRRLGIGSGGLAFWVAAIRESFEEAGVLLAYDQDGIVDLDDAASAERWSAHRRQVDDGELTMVELCRLEGLRLAVDGMHYFSHWITPEGSPRRYDTRFFLAAAPENQTPLHDDRETIANEWLRPADALARVDSGELTMMPPTVASLRAIARFDTAAAALDAAREITHVPEVLPRIIADGGGMRIVLPGDPSYDGPQAVPDATVDWMGLAAAGPVTGFEAEGSS